MLIRRSAVSFVGFSCESVRVHPDEQLGNQTYQLVEDLDKRMGRSELDGELQLSRLASSQHAEILSHSKSTIIVRTMKRRIITATSSSCSLPSGRSSSHSSSSS